MIVLVMSILLIMALMGMTSHFQTSGTGRTFKRVLDIRTAIEAGESAIGEAVTAVRKSMDTGTSTPECSENWRQLLLSSLESGGSMPSQRTVKAKNAQELYLEQGLAISEVRVDVIDLFLPRPNGGQSVFELELPQGVLEFSVDVTTANARLINVKKRIRQRRAFYVWVDPATANPNGDIDSTRCLFRLLSNSLGTVIE